MMKHILSMIVFGALLAAPLADASNSSGRKATSFVLKDIRGKQYDLRPSLGKKVIVMSFWATWCTPCMAEMPILDGLYKKYKDQGLEVIAVSIDDPKSADKVGPMVKRHGYTFPVVIDSETRVVTSYNPKKLVPYTVVVDRGGLVANEKIGYQPGDEIALENELRALLGLPPAGDTSPVAAPEKT